MRLTPANVVVGPDAVDPFIAAARASREASVSEPGKAVPMRGPFPAGG